MQNNNERDEFRFTYSADRQAEVKRIREKYTNTSKAEDGMTRLRRLDGRPAQIARTVSLCLGVIGALILGLGMSIIMSDLGEYMFSNGTAAIAVGVIAGVVGAALAALAYPMYNVVLMRERKRIAPEILRLTDELMM
ncbi:MAG: hypothetical protein IJX38_06315 [Clostridia bacterium]|nr:hypothetical protein [Clostridia bacterium]